MVEHERATDLRRHEQERQQDHADDQVCLVGRLAGVECTLLVLADVPAVQVCDEYQVIDDGVCDTGLDPRHHGALCFALGVLLPGPAVLADHPDQLLVAGHDGRHRRDQAGAQEEIRQPRDVDEGRGRAEAAGQERRLDPDRGQGIEDVEAPGKRVEGDREVDDGRVHGVALIADRRVSWESFPNPSTTGLHLCNEGVETARRAAVFFEEGKGKGKGKGRRKGRGLTRC